MVVDCLLSCCFFLAGLLALASAAALAPALVPWVCLALGPFLDAREVVVQNWNY